MLRFSKPSAELVEGGRPAGPRIVWAAQGGLCCGAPMAPSNSPSWRSCQVPETPYGMLSPGFRSFSSVCCFHHAGSHGSANRKGQACRRSLLFRPVCGLALFPAPPTLRAICFTTFSSLSPLSSFLSRRCNFLYADSPSRRGSFCLLVIDPLPVRGQGQGGDGY